MSIMYVDGKPRRYVDCGDVPSGGWKRAGGFSWRRVVFYNDKGQPVSEHTLPDWFMRSGRGRLRTGGHWYSFTAPKEGESHDAENTD